jgi:hypothetical protein
MLEDKGLFFEAFLDYCHVKWRMDLYRDLCRRREKLNIRFSGAFQVAEHPFRGFGNVRIVVMGEGKNPQMDDPRRDESVDIL